MFPIWSWQFGLWIVVFLFFGHFSWSTALPCQDHWLLLRLSSALKLLEWRSPSLIDQKPQYFAGCSGRRAPIYRDFCYLDWCKGTGVDGSWFVVGPVFGWTWGIKKWNWLYYWYLFAGTSPFFLKLSPVDDYAFGWLWFVRPFGPCFHLVFCNIFWAFIVRCS